MYARCIHTISRQRRHYAPSRKETKTAKHMKKILLSALLLAGMATNAGAQLLYKISGNGLTAPSYVIGTHHLANVSFVDKIPGVKDALTATEQVYGELNMNLMSNTDTIAAFTKKLMLPEGKSLKTVLNDTQYKKLDAFLKEFMGVGLGSPIVFNQFGKMTPAYLTFQLQALIFLQHHMGDFDPSSTFDQYFQAQAKKNNEPVGGLETYAFQANLIAGEPMDRQVTGLMCLIDNVQATSTLLDEMTDAYYAQNIEGVKTAMDKQINADCGSTPEEKAAIIDNRNADWANRMPAIMQDKPTFFAVGAGHLAGEKGLLQLLTNAGYTVEAVK